MTQACVVAVVVTYHPDRQLLMQLFAQLRPQVAHIVQVDNTDGPAAPGIDTPTQPAPCPHTTVLSLGTNVGIGQAQNLGIEQAQQLGATHVLLLDQDSLPPAGLVAQQLEVLAAQGADKVAAIGPLCRDVKTNQIMPLIQRQGLRIRRFVPQQGEAAVPAPVPVAYIPASGTLIPMQVLAHVGPMRADYFIDRVDVEWCLRANRLGLAVWVDPRVEMAHNQGLHAARILTRTIYVGHDFRRYFHVRNSLAMALRAPIPLFWRIDQLLKIPGYVLLYSSMAHKRRLSTFRLLMTAVVDGLRGRMGKGHYEQRPFS